MKASVLFLFNKRNTKNPKLLPQGNPVCAAGLATWKDGKFSDNGRTRQKFCCPLKSSKDTDCPCHHKNFYNGKNIVAVQNTLLFWMICGLLLTEKANTLKVIILSAQNVNGTIPGSKIQDRNACG